MFSSRTTFPEFNEATAALADSPTTSVANTTSRFKSSDNRIETGARDSSGLRSPLGRPRCAQITIDAPLSISALIVGSEALILPSSVIAPSFNGTFKSQRRNTRFPFTSREARLGIDIRAIYLHNRLDQLIDLSNPIHCHTNQQLSQLCHLL